MKFIDISVGKSINPNTGEEWWRADTKVLLEENEVPEDVFKEVRSRVDNWLPNPMPSQGKPSGDIFFNVTTQKEERV